MRVGGRLKNSHLSYNSRHPIILFKKAHLTLLLVLELHVSSLHSEPSIMLGLLSSTHYIIGGKQLIRDVTRMCLICRKHYVKIGSPLMGVLRTLRVSLSPLFTETGLDFFGPITIRRRHTRKPVYCKCYIYVFGCLSTKRIHLELCPHLSTDSFMATLRHFVARCGCPYKIYSDNGTNFV